MKLTVRSGVVLLVSLFSGMALASEWQIDPAHSSAQFSVRHMMVTDVKGELGTVSGKVNLGDKNIAKSTVEASIDVTGINTREPKRDAHLKSPDFFDTANYPNITFKSTQIKPIGKEKYKVSGDLTIRGVTKPVTLEVESPKTEIKDPYGMVRRGVHATTVINRKDYGLEWNAALEGGGVVVGDQVKVTLDVELTRKADGAAAPEAKSVPMAPTPDAGT